MLRLTYSSVAALIEIWAPYSTRFYEGANGHPSIALVGGIFGVGRRYDQWNLYNGSVAETDGAGSPGNGCYPAHPIVGQRFVIAPRGWPEVSAAINWGGRTSYVTWAHELGTLIDCEAAKTNADTEH
jgi:hypothetical protein